MQCREYKLPSLLAESSYNQNDEVQFKAKEDFQYFFSVKFIESEKTGTIYG
jgi:hypothetical protein